jgi:hypothetical protein
MEKFVLEELTKWKEKNDRKPLVLTSFLGTNLALKAVRYSMLSYREQGQLLCVPLYAV